MDKARGNERDKLLIMAGKQSFVWIYLEEDGHLGRYAHDSCSSTQGCHVGRRKWRIKEGPTTTEDQRLISHHDRPVKGFCHQIPHHDGLEVSAVRSLTTDRMLMDFPGPAT